MAVAYYKSNEKIKYVRTVVIFHRHQFLIFSVIMLLVLLCVSGVFLEIESARILGIFQIPSISHQVVFRPLMKELASRGHEVVVLTTDPAYPNGTGPPNLIEIDIHDISYSIWNNFTKSGVLNSNDPRSIIKAGVGQLGVVFEKQVTSSQVQNLINNKKQKFDLLFIDTCLKLSLSFWYLYKVPIIEISSLGPFYGSFDNIVSPIHPLIYPVVNQQNIYDLTIWEKISELYCYYGIRKAFEQLEISENKLLKKVFGPDIPNLEDLKKNVHMLFLNVHSVWNFNRPVPKNILYLESLHVQRNLIIELPQDLKSVLDSSLHGVIYFSFGTNVMPSALPEEKIKSITQVLSELPYDILFKWDSDKLPVHSSNVRFSKWFPQSDLLKHQKMKLFITQGGLQSTDEAITAGVPLVVIPMISDQWFNAEQYEFHGIGKKLLLEDLNKKSFKEAIQSVIENSSYRHNVVRLRNIMHDDSQTSLEKGIWWAEYVLRQNGADHLRPHGANLPWYEYYEVIKIFILLALVLLILISLGCAIVKFIIKHVKCKIDSIIVPNLSKDI